jgi:hypothetical protein
MMNFEKGKYTLEGVTRQTMESAIGFACENCGRGIVNIAHITHTETGAKQNVGTECAKTLCGLPKDKEEIRRLEKWLPKETVEHYMKQLHKGVFFKKGQFGDWIEVNQRKIGKEGKPIVVFIDNFKAKDFPESLLDGE